MLLAAEHAADPVAAFAEQSSPSEHGSAEASSKASDLRRCRQILSNSPTALRVLKAALNAAEDGHAGLQVLGGEATSLFYQTAEGNEVGSA